MTRSLVEDELLEANALLRSVHSIATRQGVETNWDAFLRRIDEALQRQHPIINALEANEAPVKVTLPDGSVYGLTIEQGRRALAAALTPTP